MKEYTITANEANQRLDKYLRKLLPGAPAGFLYKMLRKKSIVCNGAKAAGGELLQRGDRVKLFLSDDTILKFSREDEALHAEYEALRKLPMKGLKIVYEDADILAADKPYNMLSQKAAAHDLSANEYLLGYLIRGGALQPEGLRTFRPSVCNRLDRNTTGLILMGKTLAGSQKLSEGFKDRSIRKYYRAIVAGSVKEGAHLSGYLIKDERTNRVQVLEDERTGASRIETDYTPVTAGEGWTLLEVHLITGKTHQIRAHLAAAGHPVIGDRKYGDAVYNKRFQQQYEVTHQLLHAYRLAFPDGRTLCAGMPPEFMRILPERFAQEETCPHGIHAV